jgi:CRP/FNR family transcriptional regulator, anaerobic regulatory protein
VLKREGIIELEGKRHVKVGDFDRLSDLTGDDADGGMLG